jgi:dTDP-4-amino-4,6-dideoxygalactose transaminase
MSARIPFNRPFAVGSELDNIREAIAQGHLSGDGKFTSLCNQWLAKETNATKALLTHSCTAALEMAALLADVGPGDEVVMPSYTFVSTANAFALRGATPVFVDIRADTLNIDETLIDDAITDRTRAIVPVHYAGVGCEMDSILDLARRRGLLVIEDAAQAVLSTYRGRPLGALGDMGAVSFHETKNVISGEGGALLLRDHALVQRAEIIREKGTNRTAFFRGQVDKYTWVDVGSSFLPSELVAAFLWAQLEEAVSLTERRVKGAVLSLNFWVKMTSTRSPFLSPQLLCRNAPNCADNTSRSP